MEEGGGKKKGDRKRKNAEKGAGWVAEKSRERELSMKDLLK